jgi:hypothetical protein
MAAVEKALAIGGDFCYVVAAYVVRAIGIRCFVRSLLLHYHGDNVADVKAYYVFQSPVATDGRQTTASDKTTDSGNHSRY